jgi:hypothetical protein
MGLRKYVVEARSMLNDWENCWIDDTNTPVVFNTKRDATQALNEFIAEEQEAFKQGYIDEDYILEDYRIRRVDNDKD